ncbi:unnamed protein product, partial [Rotaria sp. Silwood1]
YTDDNDPDHTVCCHPIIVTYPLVNGDPVPTYTCHQRSLIARFSRMG